MDMPVILPGFAAYELVQVDTGTRLYQTCATAQEIHDANANFRQRDIASRFFPVGTFTAPSLHSAS